MKIDFVLTACNLNNHYLSLYPYVVRIWKEKFNLDCHLVLISDEIPDFLKIYADKIILFKPIDGINTIFIAQVIRILYPCLYDNKNILITDVDIFPISYKYFIGQIENFPDNNNIFVSYRDSYLKQNMLSICYNLANSGTWQDIFNIKNIDDITKKIKDWYDPKYDGKKNCPGWFTDQKNLYQYVMLWKVNNPQKLIILKDNNTKFNRLDKRQRKYIVSNFSKVLEDIKNGVYSDYHSIKPYTKFRNLTIQLTDTICKINC